MLNYFFKSLQLKKSIKGKEHILLMLTNHKKREKILIQIDF